MLFQIMFLQIYNLDFCVNKLNHMFTARASTVKNAATLFVTTVQVLLPDNDVGVTFWNQLLKLKL